jgi:hypothetical protein
MQLARKLKNHMFKKILSYILPEDPTSAEAIIRRNIKREVAKLGGNVFGPIPAGRRREFFSLDEHTWIWHEEWTDGQGQRQVRTTRYDVRPLGLYKAQDGMPYQPVSIDEGNRLCSAALEYKRIVHEKFDPLLAAAGA